MLTLKVRRVNEMWPLALHRFAPLYIEFHSLGKRNLHCNGHDMNRSIWNSWLEDQRLRGGARDVSI